MAPCVCVWRLIPSAEPKGSRAAAGPRRQLIHSASPSFNLSAENCLWDGGGVGSFPLWLVLVPKSATLRGRHSDFAPMFAVFLGPLCPRKECDEFEWLKVEGKSPVSSWVPPQLSTMRSIPESFKNIPESFIIHGTGLGGVPWGRVKLVMLCQAGIFMSLSC